MELLVLGGTAFLGHEVARQAVGRGHRVTCLARGSAEPPAGAAFVRADRGEEDGLAAVRDRTWDVVVDVARRPDFVRRAVRDLSTEHRVFVSTGNVYADFSRIEQDEDAALLAPLVGEPVSEEDYGPGKVACEQAVLGAGPAAIVRAGLIGGPGDWSGRTGYWPWRFAHPVGDEVVVPDDLSFPCALIDVRDLAGWLVDLAERRVVGIFNATGPTTDLATVLDAAAQVAGSSARPRGRWASSGCANWASAIGWGSPRCRCGSTIPTGAGSPRWTPAGRGPRVSSPDRWSRRWPTRWRGRSPAAPRLGAADWLTTRSAESSPQ